MGKNRKRGRRPKQPAVEEVPHPRKQPATAAVAATNNELRPSWRLARMEMAEPFGWHVLSADKLREIRDKLSGLESRTWNEILVRSKKHNHAVSLDKLARPARKRLEDLKILEEEMISLRLGGKERVWGYRAEHGVLELVWWDPEHRVCPAPKKRT